MFRCCSALGHALVLVFSSSLLASEAVRHKVDDTMLIIEISGEITSNTADEITDLLRRHGSNVEIVDVTIDSGGGDIDAAMRIGRELRRHAAWTTVSRWQDNGCHSACVLVFAAGVARIASNQSIITIHRPYFDHHWFAGLDRNAAESKYKKMAEDVRVYLEEMGISDRLFEMMMTVPSRETRRLSGYELQETNLIGEDSAYWEWIHAKNVAELGAERLHEIQMRDKAISEYIRHCMAREYPFRSQEHERAVGTICAVHANEYVELQGQKR